VQAVLTALYAGPARRPRPRLVALAAGTTNMIAGDVGHPGDQVWALRRLAHWLRTGVGRVVRLERQVLHLAVPGHEPQCGLFCGVGLISRGVGFYREHLHNRGLAGVPGIALTLVRAVGGAALRPGQQATPLTVRVDGRPLVGRAWLFLLVTTLDHLFFGLRPFWGDRHGPLRYTAVRSRAPRLLRLLPQLGRGRAHPLGTAANGYFSGSGQEIRLFLDSPLALDGELFTPATAAEPTVFTSAGRVHFLRVES
jgi:diacylglycerol kinase family enzyme